MERTTFTRIEIVSLLEAQAVPLLVQPPQSEKATGSILGRGSFCMQHGCSPCVCLGSLWVLRLLTQSKNMHHAWEVKWKV